MNNDRNFARSSSIFITKKLGLSGLLNDKLPIDVFVNFDLSQSDHFKSEPLLPELLPYMRDAWGFRGGPEGATPLNSLAPHSYLLLYGT
ncbi:hypothetical protein Q75_15765, partial [Bacillus coahuilensis p1.1.43]